MSMNEPYELLKGYIPIKSALKIRAEGDMLITSNGNSEVYYLNDMAGEIWGMIDGIKSVAELVREILNGYDADPEQVNADMVNFIRDMQWKKLIRLKEGASHNEEV